MIEGWQRIATGRLGWKPKAFWKATAQELRSAIEGLTGRSVGPAISQKRMSELVAEHGAPSPSLRKR